jgi:hypothetical protein
MSSVTKWRVYCNTEGVWSYGYKDTSEGSPTTCFNNTGHEIQENSQQELEVISTDTINAKIVEEYVPTGGNFRCCGKKFNIPANSTVTYTVSWPFNISVLQSFFTSSADMEGDVVDVVTAPNTIIGVLTAPVAIGDTVINVNTTVFQHLMVGYTLKLGNSNVSLGYVLAIDENALTVTVQTPSPEAFSAGTTYVKTEVIGIHDLEIGAVPFRYIIGSSKTGGKHLPVNTTVNVTYTNNGNTQKTFRFQIELLY